MKIKQSKKKPDFQNMSLDNFLDNMDVDAGEEEPETKPKSKLKANGIDKAKKKIKAKGEGSTKEQLQPAVSESNPKKKAAKTLEPEDTDEEYDEDAAMEEVEREHQLALSKLEKTDPELFAFLKKNDEKLLKFGAMDSDISDFSDSEDEADKEEDEEEGVHKPSGKLEVASDESDFEPDEEQGVEKDEEDGDDGDEEEEAEADGGKKGPAEHEPGTKITFKMLRAWTKDLTTLPVKYVHPIRNICYAFSSAIHTVTGDQGTIPPYRVEGSAMFNAIVQTCVLHLVPAVRSYLRLTDKRQFKDIKKDKKFIKVRACLKNYLADLTNLIENVSSTHIMSVLLKHLHQFSWILIRFPLCTKPILKRMIVIWSTSDEETIRVLAFLVILKVTYAQKRYLSVVLKAMYLAYVKNSKFVSPNTLPNINFMRRSLSELFLIDFNVAYQHMFLYIRQLAIHLRNATVLQKKESLQYIYNWQYINSLKLWGDILGTAHGNGNALEPLIYPLVSITIGVIKLTPSAQYFPLRFHCCRILTQLNAKTRIYIPVLPFLVEVLKSNSFNEKHKKLSLRPVNLTCLLRFAPANIQENGYKDAVLDQIYELILEFAANESASVAYPEIVLPIILQLRQYAKATTVYKYARKMKQLSDKLMENYEFMDKRRSKLDIPLADTDRIRGWEETVRASGTPLRTFYATYAKEAESAKRRLATDSEKIGDYNLPTLKKVDRKPKEKQDGPVTLFPSDDEDEDDESVGFGDSDEAESDDGDNVDSEAEDDDAMSGTEDSDEEVDDAEVKVPQGKQKKKQQTNGKQLKKQKNPSAQEADDYPLENVKDTDQVDILQDLKLDDWDD
ncbi:nucleolar complex protein 2 homolog [Anopheles ziemanni]|uniref:nucleolar complex protein 2 homolog n=1 Tax=Anopheles ziemanni TaxID=345580 RepID=UPI00265EDD57|nr:nucleolar complex protein 2 homolog [Anopheles ziemanni]